ncbi:cytochrome c maturation protein CcmE [Arenimonas sp.]|uniref:cytochrome c maturation protein CcmE n=1 Tax=Arenimonas sp. TaxID=1872635 RepID=UPI0039E2DC6F
MNPTRKRRLALVGLLLLAAATAAVLIAFALQENLTYLHTPSEVRAGKSPADARFRLGGVVCLGSVKRTNGTLLVDFSVTDGQRQVPVQFNGILPDMFKEGTSIIATGRMQQQRFVATEVLAKHDETYMPEEVAKGMSPEMLAKMRESGNATHSLSCGAN